jgi:hypothetical protein
VTLADEFLQMIADGLERHRENRAESDQLIDTDAKEGREFAEHFVSELLYQDNRILGRSLRDLKNVISRLCNHKLREKDLIAILLRRGIRIRDGRLYAELF